MQTSFNILQILQAGFHSALVFAVLGIRNELLASEDHTCPKCGESRQSPDQLIANKFLRTAVNNYLNETGYTKAKATPKQTTDGTPSATPDFNTGSPAVDSPAPYHTPPPPHEAVSDGGAMLRATHNLPSELVGLPPQVRGSHVACEHKEQWASMAPLPLLQGSIICAIKDTQSAELIT